jgi:hypothetical protein
MIKPKKIKKANLIPNQNKKMMKKKLLLKKFLFKESNKDFIKKYPF